MYELSPFSARPVRRLRPATLLAALAVLLVALFSLACSGDGTEESASTSTSVSTSTSLVAPSATAPEGTETTAVSTSSTSTAPRTSTTKTSLLSSSEKDLGNGRVRAGGFVEKAYEEGGQRRIDIDYADFLSGEEAEAAAAAVGEEVNNDYFIRNLSSKLRTFRVTAGSFELPQGDPTTPVMGDWAQFKAFLAEYPGTYWWIERRGDEVVLLEGQWVP